MFPVDRPHVIRPCFSPFFGEEERRSERIGEERNRKRYAVSDDEVCVPYKRKNLRTNQKQSAAALVYKKEINLTS